MNTSYEFLVEDDNKKIELSLIKTLKYFAWYVHVVYMVGHSAVVALLLENGAEYSVSDSNGATPLHYAAQNNHHVS